MLTPESAWNRIAARAAPLGTVARTRRDALGRTLARPLVAGTEVPPADVSALDGFAYAGEIAPGAILPIAATVAAGDAPGCRLAPGSAARIWTGAPVPYGADRVIGVEVADEIPADRVRILQPANGGAAIRRRGEVIASGDRLLEPGAPLGPAALALLASQGIEEVEVYRPPAVALLATGDEVVSPELEPRAGQLRDSHTDFLLAAGHRLGLEFEPLGIAPDDPGLLTSRIALGLERFDVTLVCGGVSMGGRDHTESVLTELGVELDFDRVAVQPGKPLVFGHKGKRLVFGLPGNPASVMVAFRLFVRPALARLEGRKAAFWSDARALPLAAPLAAGKPRDRFVPGRLDLDADAPRARPLAVHGSHDLATFARADLLLRVRAGAAARDPGELVEAIDWE